MRRRITRWSLAIGIGVAAHVALYWLIIVPERALPEPEPSTMQATQLSYMDSSLLQRQIELFDPQPLVLPTRWNVANALRLGEFLDEQQTIFSAYDPIFSSGGEGAIVEQFGNAWAALPSIGLVQSAFAFNPLAAMGRLSSAQPAVAEPALRVRLVGAKDGEEAREGVYYNNVAQALSLQSPGWEPASFLVEIENSFLVQPLSLAEGSGSVEADELLSAFATEIVSRDWVLPDGSYLLEIGP